MPQLWASSPTKGNMDRGAFSPIAKRMLEGFPVCSVPGSQVAGCEGNIRKTFMVVSASEHGSGEA